jgi:hypothetical protein
MSALCRAYENIADAERAVTALLAGGVPGEDVRMVRGAASHDARREAHGSFAGAVVPGEHVGAFAGDGSTSDAPRGAFAAGAPDGEGDFGNADRDVVVTWPGGREHSRIAGHRRLERLLVDAGLDAATARADVRAVHDGRVLVLVSTAAMTADSAVELLDRAG